VNHCLAQIFRVGLALSLTERDVVGRSVIFYNQRMIHRDICRALFKVTYRVAACRHHIAKQLIGLCDCASRAVNEPRLDAAPRLYEACTITWGQRSNVQTLHSCGALFEPGLCMAPASVFFHSAVVFAAKLRTESFGAALSKGKPRDYAYNYKYGETND